ncbi:MAG: glycosyltransferase family 1 protein [Aeromicrobium erythreum]
MRHLVAVDEPDARVVRLPDPPASGRGPDGGPSWWPPAVLDPGWIRAHGPEVDVVHVHFGFDALAPADLRAVVQALRETGTALVLTVHDLRNPHHATRELHDTQLDVLVPAADALLTLTDGAAAEVERRWGRRPEVVAHPHVVDLDVMARLARRRPAPARRGGPFRVGIHVKSLRACMDPWTVLPALSRAVAAVPGGVLQVDGHTDVLDPAGARFDAELAGVLRSLPGEVDLRVHDFFTDAELVGYLAGLDLSVLPYRFGTHSGWLEACRDVGTPVAAPTCGFYADQAPVHSFVLDEDRFDEDSLARGVRDAFTEAPVPAATVEERRRERERLDVVHARLYERVVGA